MQCPKCSYEPLPDALLCSPCPECGYLWVDTYQYVKMLADPILPIKTVLDIGCGKKGTIGQHYFETVAKITQGFACDIHVVKDLPTVWTPLVMDAEDLLSRLGPRSIDFVTHCGMLEHVHYDKALRILRVIEQVAKKRVFFTCSAMLREVDYKCKADGNPNHAYRSFWSPAVFDALGYHVDTARMRAAGGNSGREATFSEEVPVWYDPDDIVVPWEAREHEARSVLCRRRCHHTTDASDSGHLGHFACPHEPVVWSPYTNSYACIKHYPEIVDLGHDSHKPPLERWRQRADFSATFPHPPWREKWTCDD